VAHYTINSAGASSPVIREIALKTRSVGTKPLRPAVLLTAFTAIYKHASLCDGEDQARAQRYNEV
jgi:hypothetical protein